MNPEWLKFNNSFCPLPFLHLHIDTVKDKRLCCLSADKIEGDTSFNTDTYRKVRQDMLDNKPVDACRICQGEEKQKLISRRQKTIAECNRNSVHRELLQQQIDKHLEGQDLAPYWYDLRISNNCNLACQICNHRCSSTIAKKQNRHDPYFSYEIDVDINPRSTNIYLAGGEPFLIKKFVSMLEKVENTDCEVVVNTNGTTIAQPLITQLSRFKSVHIIVSIDGYGKLNEKLREGSSWEAIDRNIDRFIELGYTVNIATAVQKENINELIHLANYIDDKKIDSWNLIEVVEPAEFNWKNNQDIDIERLEELKAMPLLKKNITSLLFLKYVTQHV